MKSYTGKTVEEALQSASTETGVAIDDLIYIVSDKRKGLFAKKIVVEVYDLADVIRFAEDYLLGVTDALEIESSVNTKLDDEVIRITIDSTHNPILIGRNGKTLQALNELVKLAVSNHFHKRFRILLYLTVPLISLAIIGNRQPFGQIEVCGFCEGSVSVPLEYAPESFTASAAVQL